MGTNLNLSQAQKERIVAAETPDEKARILSEVQAPSGLTGPTELSVDELAGVSGGWRPQTKEEADEKIAFILKLREDMGDLVTTCYLEQAQIAKFNEGNSFDTEIIGLKNEWYRMLGIDNRPTYGARRSF